MKSISRNLSFNAAALLALIVGTVAATAFGQTATANGKSRSEYKNKEKGFCNSNNWSDGDRVSFNEVREMTFPSSGSVNVDGRQNGGVKVIGEDRSDVLVRACVQAWSKSEDAAKSLASNVKINTSGTIKAENSDGNDNWSVSYEIRVPRATNLSLTAHNGGISITGVDGNAEFETQNGGVFLSNASGSFKGHTTNGGVSVQLSGNSWKGSGLDVATTNGGVNITLPKDYAANIETGTVNGGYSSDIPALAITTENIKGDDHYRPRSKRIQTNINGGGAPIRVVTTNGGVRIGTGDDKD